ncbi:inter-alpha-trypsin inhibitor [Genypterus blacodes]|uniref:inter-alpha-trypsin inhibitor n=1 Tax=Genypterus blacodes TaxID=154954 RepID=UPI003F76AABD
MKHLLIFGLAFAAFHTSQSTKPDFCLLKQDAGEGSLFEFSLFYDAAEDTCEPFLYKGAGGNANRFQNEIECVRNCSSRVNQIYPLDVKEACHFRYTPGKCSGNSLRYYYDSIHDKCKTFIWSGCFGNGNRFLNQQMCNDTCAGIHDEGDELEEDEPDTPIGIICGVVIGVIAAIIITVVVVLTVKSKKKSKEAKVKKSKEPAAELPLQEPAIEMA